MTNCNDGTIHGWNGGDCPVHPQTEVEYWLRYGGSATSKAGDCHWSHSDHPGDIIAFRATKAHVEPKVFWVVRYVPTDGLCLISRDEAGAWKYAGDDPENRRVEKYQEVPL